MMVIIIAFPVSDVPNKMHKGKEKIDSVPTGARSFVLNCTDARLYGNVTCI